MHTETTEPIFMKFCIGVLLSPVSVLAYINLNPFLVGVKWAWVSVVPVIYSLTTPGLIWTKFGIEVPHAQRNFMGYVV